MNVFLKALGVALLAISLSGCGVGASPEGGGSDDNGDDGAATVNETAGLTGYPGATGVEVTEDGLDTRTTFGSDATLAEVYAHFDGELTAQGWVRTGLEDDDDEIEAVYAREGRILEFELERDDGGFELDIDIDGDNAAYDEDNGVGDDDDAPGGDGAGDDGADDGDDTGEDDGADG